MLARKVLSVFAGSVLGIAAATAAYGTTAYGGADYSYVDNNNRNAVICDREADSRTAYVSGRTIAGNNFRVNDQDGSSGQCWFATYDSGVANHITCEDINNAPDNCGTRSYH